MTKQLLISSAVILFAIACNPESDDTPAPTIYMLNDGKYEISIDDTLLIHPKITYDQNSSYIWTDEENNVVCTELIYELIPSKRKDYHLNFSVKNSNGEDNISIKVVVAKNIDCDSVDNYRFPLKNNVLHINDTIAAPEYKHIAFNNSIIDDEAKLWQGFIRSTRSDGSKLKSPKDNIGCVYLRNTSNAGKNTYMAVCCTDGNDAHIVFKDKSYIVKSIDIANDFSVYATSYEGQDTVSYEFLSSIPHSLTVTPIGCDINGNAIIEGNPIKLIECTYDDNKTTKLSYIEMWNTIDLSYLGAVHGLKFKVHSDNKYIKEYFCLDNLKLQDP